jgi:competence protein ComEC
MLYPAALPALALAAGIAAGVFLPADPVLGLLALAFCWLGAAVAFVLGRDRILVANVAVGFAMAGVSLGAQANAAALRTPLGALFDRHVPPLEYQLFANIEGRLRADGARPSANSGRGEPVESRGPTSVSLSIQVDRIQLNGGWQPTSGGVIVGVGGELGTHQVGEWRAGRRVRLPATLRRPAKYLDPGVPDAGRDFAWKGTSLVGSAKSEALVEVIAPGGRLSEALAAIRASVRDAVASSVAPWSERSAAVVTAILIGDRAGLDDEMQRQLQEAGTYHVIAISGGNIAILAGLCVLLLRVSRIGPRPSALLIVATLVVYALVVGGGSSVGRATLMAVIYFIAQFSDHRTQPGNVAAVAAILLFSVAPLEIVDASFALTFGATLGLVVGMPMLAPSQSLPGWIRAMLALLAASVCAEIALLPVSAFVFSRVTAAGLLLNFAAIPLMTAVQISGVAVVAMAHLSARAALWVGWVAHLGVQGLLASASLVDLAPWTVRRVPSPSLGVVGGYYAGLVLALLAHAQRRGRARAFGATVVVLCGWWIVAAPVLDGRAIGTRPSLRVTFMDVGQGDAAIVQFPDGRSLSVDAGGLAGTAFDIGSRVVSPTLWAGGLRRLDYMSISHGDPDHIGGAASVFRDFRPIEVWEGVAVPSHEPTKRLRQLAEHAGVPWRTLQPGDRMSFGDVLLSVHHPPAPDWERQKVRNDDSEVIEIAYGGASFVFTGDISWEAERTIAASFQRAPIRILKVPHHGSASSSSTEFLRALHPDIAVISDGRGNPYGHPVQAVLDRYRAIGAAVYRTDLDGAVIVDTDGQTVHLRTFTNRRLTLRTHGR